MGFVDFVVHADHKSSLEILALSAAHARGAIQGGSGARFTKTFGDGSLFICFPLKLIIYLDYVFKNDGIFDL